MGPRIRVGNGRIISMRYTMKNADGQIIASDTASFLYGSGAIMPGLETPLTGLQIGEQKSFSLSPDDNAQLDETFYFDVIIHDVRWPSESQEAIAADQKDNCGPGCEC